MRPLLIPLSLAALGLACSPAARPDGGADGGDQLPVVTFTISGTAYVHPDGVAWLADAGRSLSLAGLTLRVEEPIKVATYDPTGLFSTHTLDATGAFTSPTIDQELVVLGVAAGIRDDGDAGAPRVVRSATVLYDDALEGKKPAGNLTGAKAYAIPTGFHDQLTAAVGSATIRALATDATDAGTLVEAGCVLGRVVDAAGRPVAGITVQPSQAAAAARLFYPTADLTGTTTATSSNGLFVYVHSGNTFPAQFSFTIAGHGEYKTRSAGAAKDSCVVLTVYPGTTQP